MAAYRHPTQLFSKTMLSAAVASAMFAVAPAQAFEFTLADGEVKGSFDTTLSYGVLMRADKRDSALVGAANGGTNSSTNADDGNRTYDRGDVISSLFKMNNDLELSYRNFGFFGRTLAYYDTAIESKNASTGGTSSGLSPEAKKRLKDDARILDFYVRGSFDLGGKALNARLGRQVINWGESTFIPNGINSINPVDVARLRAPGSEIKEGLLPQEMLWASQELTDKVSVEAFYQFKWRETRIDPRGSFFSTTDVLSPGATTLVGLAPMPIVDVRNPGDSGQFGLAARVLAPSLNNTEFGVFAMTYHSRTPFLSLKKGGTAMGDFGKAIVEYPSDIRLYGLSASGSLADGTALQAEYSYRPDQPLQISAIELIAAAAPNGFGPGAPPGGVGLPAAINTFNQAGVSSSAPAGSYIQGYREVKMHQIQSTATKSFGPQLGASQVTALGEVGLTYLDLPDGILFEGPGASVPASLALRAGQPAVNPNGYATKRSWGYRLLTRADYPNALGSATLTPRIAFAHDVRGVGPTFNQGTQSINFGVTANWRNTWQADLSYTGFMGGRTYTGRSPLQSGGAPFVFASSANQLKDRDFIAATVSYSF